MADIANFIPLMIVCGLAFLLPFIASRFPYFTLPFIVTEIVAGIILGNSGLGLITIDDQALPEALMANQWLDFLALFGFTFLMFLSGLEIDFTQIRTTKVCFEPDKFLGSVAKDPLYLGIMYFFISLILCYIAAAFLVSLGLVENPFLMALVFTTTSVGVVVPTLHQTGIIKTEFGQNILMSSLVADFSTMLLVTVAFASLTSGITRDLLYIGFLFVAFFVIYKLGVLIKVKPKIKKAIMKKVSKAAEIRVRGAFALMLFFIVLAEILGAEIILGAFLAGAVVSLVTTEKETRVLQRKLNGAGYGFFIPIFFIMVGVRFDISALLESSWTLVLAPLLILMAFTVKLVPAHIFTQRYGSKKAVAAGVLMSSRLTLIIVVAAIGTEIGAITPAMNSAIVLVAIVTSVVSPAVFSKMAKDLIVKKERKRRGGRKKKKKVKPVDTLIRGAFSEEPYYKRLDEEE